MYLDLVVGWSDTLDVDSATIEMSLIVSESPGGRTETWLRDA